MRLRGESLREKRQRGRVGGVTKLKEILMKSNAKPTRFVFFRLRICIDFVFVHCCTDTFSPRTKNLPIKIFESMDSLNVNKIKNNQTCEGFQAIRIQWFRKLMKWLWRRLLFCYSKLNSTINYGLQNTYLTSKFSHTAFLFSPHITLPRLLSFDNNLMHWINKHITDFGFLSYIYSNKYFFP